MKPSKNPFSHLTRVEWVIYTVSLLTVMLSFLLSREPDVMTLIASLIGVTALIFVAKGDVTGQFLSVIFAALYAVISLKMKYYGEMMTYMLMTAPIAIASIVTWLRHPYKEGEREVEVAKMSRLKIVLLLLITAIVTFIFYFILKFFGTANLVPSTISVATSFLASSLMMLRSPYYALAYAANDVVLILLWVMASVTSLSYLPMVFCFLAFLINDIYGFISWTGMRKRQTK